MNASKRYFELVEGTSGKFWEIWVDDTTILTRQGEVGSAGQVTVVGDGNAIKAARLQAKLVAEKLERGYLEKRAGLPLAAKRLHRLTFAEVEAKLGPCEEGDHASHINSLRMDSNEPPLLTGDDTSWGYFAGGKDATFTHLASLELVDAVLLARELAGVLEGTLFSSDGDCTYEPFVAADVVATSKSARFASILGIPEESDRRQIEVIEVENARDLFGHPHIEDWLENRGSFDAGDVERMLAAGTRMGKALTKVWHVGFGEAEVQPLLWVGERNGFIVGVWCEAIYT